jgi:hypothetical protein
VKLYRVPTPGGYIWYGTQAGAKIGAKEFRNDWELVEVPTDKEGLLDWLNEHYAPSTDVAEDPDELEQAEQRAIAERQREAYRTGPGKDVSASWDATDIEDFILNRATVNQAANILACLGTRFKELAQGVSGAGQA